MGEILEKGLVIGFGLITSLIVVSLFTSTFSTLLSNNSASDQYEIFVFTMEYGLSHVPQYPDEELCINLSLTIQIELDIEKIGDIFHFKITSDSKSNSIHVLKPVILQNSTITGKLTCIFTYFTENIVLMFWGRD